MAIADGVKLNCLWSVTSHHRAFGGGGGVTKLSFGVYGKKIQYYTRTERETDTPTDRDTERQTYRHTNIQTDGRTVRQAASHTE